MVPYHPVSMAHTTVGWAIEQDLSGDEALDEMWVMINYQCSRQ